MDVPDPGRRPRLRSSRSRGTERWSSGRARDGSSLRARRCRCAPWFDLLVGWISARGVRSDGAVGWWDVGTGEMIGNLWTVTNDTEYSAPWFDTEKRTVWVTSGSRLLELHLEPGRWIERACDFVGRDLTSEEWDRYVPGDGPVHSACSWKVLLDLSGFSAVRELKAPIGRSPAPPRGDRSDPGKHPQPDVTPSSCELRSNDRRIERS